MPSIVIVSGSSSPTSRLNALVEASESYFSGEGFAVHTIIVSELPADDLIRANFQSEAIREKTELVRKADALIVASPVYKAAYTGVLKTFLDMIPEKGLEGKIVLPLFIGGSIAHLLAIDYALKPVLSALSARHILGGVYAVDQWIQRAEGGGFSMQEELASRLNQSLVELKEEVVRKAGLPLADSARHGN
ncbi:NADPH-dependent FMN reductase [Paenibacillus sp.]|uniref:NADPH-dependent FMN reductase n=1 Tax=Paenibacillus sp. TaxID=58172 RepID=UPI002D6C9600|nr:NADPH-dependent FMN reductase [Paenibacillus sp.]HZG87448.1 NADPH-dependent FMN reductase [Paenibacillus sp.]